MNERTQTLRDRILDTTPEICPDRGIAYTRSYQETEGLPPVLRKARALERVLKDMTVYISPGELIVGNQQSKPKSAPLFPEYGVKWLAEEVDSFPERTLDRFLVSPPARAAIETVVDYWDGKTHQDLCMGKLAYLLPGDLEGAYDTATCSLNQVICNMCHTSNGDGHIIADYGKVLTVGLGGIMEEAKEALARLNRRSEEGVKKALFLEAVVISCQAVIEFSRRYARLARQLAQSAQPPRQDELLHIAAQCERVPEHGAQSFHEALQAMWLVHVVLQIESNGQSISFGRFDQLLWPFYERDVTGGTITRQEALELVECFFVKSLELNKVREWGATEYMTGYSMFQTLTIGGQTPGGEDATNDLSYLVLEATAQLQVTEPTTVVRIHSRTPEDFFKAAVRTLLEHGGGLPAFFNDDVGIPLLLNTGQGMSLAEARDWAIMGCVEPVVPGKFNNATGGVCQINLLKLLELALNDGVNPDTGRALRCGRGKLGEMSSFDQLWEAYREQLAHYASFIPMFDSITCSSYAELNPTPFLSALIEGRIQDGKDVSEGWGSQNYNVDLVEAHGVVNVGNALAAIKKLVFEEEAIGGEELLEALHNDFAGTERLRQLLLNGAPKFGNDDPYVDELVKRVLDEVVAVMRSYRPPRGGCYGVSTQTTTSNVPYGRIVGASADGRRAREPLGDNNSPAAGTDRNGPTAAMKSVARLDHIQVAMGTLFNMKFHPVSLQGEERMHKFMNLLRTFFDDKGFQVQFNVVSPEVLRAAQEEPEAYRNLIVKVAGYSARFGDLDRQLQDQIIARSTFEV